MQHPTLQNVRIRSTRDALQVFHGVATHCLPLITRRLDAEERRNIMPGNVYVWYDGFPLRKRNMMYLFICREERGANSEPTGLGMERWYVRFLSDHQKIIMTMSSRTDGMGWGPSRMFNFFVTICQIFI